MALQDDILQKMAYQPRTYSGQAGGPAMDASKYAAMAQFVVQLANEVVDFLTKMVGEPDTIDLSANKEGFISCLGDFMRYWNQETYKDFGHQFPAFMHEVLMPEIAKVLDERKAAAAGPHQRVAPM